MNRDGPTQETRHKKGKPAEIPVPTREESSGTYAKSPTTTP